MYNDPECLQYVIAINDNVVNVCHNNVVINNAQYI